MKEDLCHAFDDRVEEYLAGDLSPEEKATFDEHLAVCPHCREVLARAKTLDRHLTAVREEPSAVLLDGVMAGVRREKAKRPLVFATKLLPMAACLSLIVSVLLLFPSLASQRKGEGAAPDLFPNDGIMDVPSADGDVVGDDEEDDDLSSSPEENDDKPKETDAEAEETEKITEAVQEPVPDVPAVTAPGKDERPSTEAPTGTKPPADPAPETDFENKDTVAPEDTESSKEETTAGVGKDPVASEDDPIGDAPVTEEDTSADRAPAEMVGPSTEAATERAESYDDGEADETIAAEANGKDIDLSLLLALLFAVLGIALLVVFFVLTIRRKRRY